jgi:hypothetical protein
VKSETCYLRVVSVLGQRYSYFLRGYTSLDYPEWIDLQWVKKEAILASLTIALSPEGVAISLPKSPFGGIWSEGDLSSFALEQFIQELLSKLKEMGVHSIRLIQAPKPYVPQHDLITYLLQKSGFRLENMSSHQFFVGKEKIEEFVKNARPKYSLKIKESNLEIRVGSLQEFQFLYEIGDWNSQRGYEVRFDENRLISQVSDYPERYYLISVFHKNKALAHTVAVKLTEDSMYYYLSAIDPKTTLKGLGELLLFQLFQLAAEQKSAFIDLGSSEIESGPNHSLIYFKSRFSNDISNKTTWTRTLEP